MKLKRREISGREKNKASIKLLEQLREELYSDEPSSARRAASNLSWMQEDGLDILKEALFSKAARRAKNAAAYGLRRTHGRMKKVALEVFKQGLAHGDSDTREVCRDGLSLLSEKAQEKPPSEGPAEREKLRIREIPSKSRQKGKSRKKGKEKHLLPDEDFSQK